MGWRVSAPAADGFLVNASDRAARWFRRRKTRNTSWRKAGRVDRRPGDRLVSGVARGRSPTSCATLGPAGARSGCDRREIVSGSTSTTTASAARRQAGTTWPPPRRHDPRVVTIPRKSGGELRGTPVPAARPRGWETLSARLRARGVFSGIRPMASSAIRRRSATSWKARALWAGRQRSSPITLPLHCLRYGPPPFAGIFGRARRTL